jgi:hypothetical protein
MPLLEGDSEDVLRENIAELRRSGFPEEQAVAVALQKQREHVRAKQGGESPLAAAARAASAAHEQGESATERAAEPEQTRFHKAGMSESVAEAMAEGEKPRTPEPVRAKKPSSDELPQSKTPRRKPSSTGGTVPR